MARMEVASSYHRIIDADVLQQQSIEDMVASFCFFVADKRLRSSRRFRR